MSSREPLHLPRRGLLAASASATALLSTGSRAGAAVPAQVRARLTMPSGVQSGDVTAHDAVLWARSSGEGRMVARLRSGSIQRLVRGPLADEHSGGTARIEVSGLAAGREYDATVWFEAEDGTRGEERRLGFRTAAVHPAATSFGVGNQFFGHVDIEASGLLRVSLRDGRGGVLWSKELEPA